MPEPNSLQKEVTSSIGKKNTKRNIQLVNRREKFAIKLYFRLGFGNTWKIDTQWCVFSWFFFFVFHAPNMENATQNESKFVPDILLIICVPVTLRQDTECPSFMTWKEEEKKRKVEKKNCEQNDVRHKRKPNENKRNGKSPIFHIRRPMNDERCSNERQRQPKVNFSRMILYALFARLIIQ